MPRNYFRNQQKGGPQAIALCYAYPRYVAQPDKGQLLYERVAGAGAGESGVLTNAWIDNFYKYANRIYVLDRERGTRTVKYDGVITIPPAGVRLDCSRLTLEAGDQIRFRTRTWDNTNSTTTIGSDVLTTGGRAWQWSSNYSVGTGVSELPLIVQYDTTGRARDGFQIEVYVNGRRYNMCDDWFSDDGGAYIETVEAKKTVYPDGTVELSIDGVVVAEGSAEWDEFFAKEDAGLLSVIPCGLVGVANGTITKSMDPRFPADGDTVTFTIDFEVLQNDEPFAATIEDILASDFTYVSSSATLGTIDDSDPHGAGIILDLGTAAAGTSGTLTIEATKSGTNPNLNSTELKFGGHRLAESSIITETGDIPTTEIDCPKYVKSIAAGTAADPITSLAHAVNYPAGVYHFNIGGQTFETYVDGEGRVTIAQDFGDGVGSLPTTVSIDETTRGILNAAIIAALVNMDEVSVAYDGTTGGPILHTNQDSAIINRVLVFQTLHGGLPDNGINGGWVNTTGIGIGITDTATCASSYPNTLDANIIHVCGQVGSTLWVPDGDLQKATHPDEIGDSENIRLQVQQFPTVDDIACFALNADGDYVGANGVVAVPDDLIAAGYTCEMATCGTTTPTSPPTGGGSIGTGYSSDFNDNAGATAASAALPAPFTSNEITWTTQGVQSISGISNTAYAFFFDGTPSPNITTEVLDLSAAAPGNPHAHFRGIESLGAADGHVYASDDGGATWVLLPELGVNNFHHNNIELTSTAGMDLTQMQFKVELDTAPVNSRLVMYYAHFGTEAGLMGSLGSA